MWTNRANTFYKYNLITIHKHQDIHNIEEYMQLQNLGGR